MVSALAFARDEYHGRVARCRVCPSRTRYLPLEPGKSKISIRIDNSATGPPDLSLKFRAVGQLREDVKVISEVAVPVRIEP